LGLGAGGLTCLAMRRSWDLKAAVIDSGIAVAILIIATFVESKFSAARGIWESHETPILFIAGGSCIASEILRLTRR
jgi:hypothetical protein